jgi:hypothetical protein
VKKPGAPVCVCVTIFDKVFTRGEWKVSSLLSKKNTAGYKHFGSKVQCGKTVLLTRALSWAVRKPLRFDSVRRKGTEKLVPLSFQYLMYDARARDTDQVRPKPRLGRWLINGSCVLGVGKGLTSKK